MVVSSPLLASLIDQVQTELSRDNASEAKKLLLKANSNNHSNSATTDNSLNDNDQSILLTLFGIVEMELLDCPTTSTSSSSSLVQDSHHIETSIQRAKSYFLRAVQSMPDSGYEKYLYLGQLCVGVDAVKCYEKGVEIIQQEMSDRVAGRGEGGGVGSGDDDEEVCFK